MSTPIISVRGLEVGAMSRHGMLRPLRGIDLDLPRGETIGLVGGKRMRQVDDRPGPAQHHPRADAHHRRLHHP